MALSVYLIFLPQLANWFCWQRDETLIIQTLFFVCYGIFLCCCFFFFPPPAVEIEGYEFSLASWWALFGHRVWGMTELQIVIFFTAGETKQLSWVSCRSVFNESEVMLATFSIVRTEDTLDRFFESFFQTTNGNFDQLSLKPHISFFFFLFYKNMIYIFDFNILTVNI